MHYTGMTFRPPYEANSLLLQVTSGCSHNTCTFCVMYKDVPYCVSPWPEIESDLREARYWDPFATRVFLENGDAFSLDADMLLELADKIHAALPYVREITGYARITNIATKTDEQLRAGMRTIYWTTLLCGEAEPPAVAVDGIVHRPVADTEGPEPSRAVAAHPGVQQRDERVGPHAGPVPAVEVDLPYFLRQSNEGHRTLAERDIASRGPTSQPTLRRNLA